MTARHKQNVRVSRVFALTVMVPPHTAHLTAAACGDVMKLLRRSGGRLRAGQIPHPHLCAGGGQRPCAERRRQRHATCNRRQEGAKREGREREHVRGKSHDTEQAKAGFRKVDAASANASNRERRNTPKIKPKQIEPTEQSNANRAESGTSHGEWTRRVDRRAVESEQRSNQCGSDDTDICVYLILISKPSARAAQDREEKRRAAKHTSSIIALAIPTKREKLKAQHRFGWTAKPKQSNVSEQTYFAQT